MSEGDLSTVMMCLTHLSKTVESNCREIFDLKKELKSAKARLRKADRTIQKLEEFQTDVLVNQFLCSQEKNGSRRPEGVIQFRNHLIKKSFKYMTTYGILDPETGIILEIYKKSTFFAALGEPEEFIGHHFLDFIAPSQKTSVVEKLMMISPDNALNAVELKLMLRNKTVDRRCQAIVLDSGKVLFILSSIKANEQKTNLYSKGKSTWRW
jgi:hypothetical protein